MYNGFLIIQNLEFLSEKVLYFDLYQPSERVYKLSANMLKAGHYVSAMSRGWSLRAYYRLLVYACILGYVKVICRAGCVAQ